MIDANLSTFIEYAMERANAIKSAVLDESCYLNDEKYQSLINLIRQERVKISFALDGWAGHATRWLGVAEENPVSRNAVLNYILRQMPAPPQELDKFVERRIGSDNLMSMRRHAVREMHSWMDDSLDAEIYRRVMQGREAEDPKTWTKEISPGVAKAVHDAVADSG